MASNYGVTNRRAMPALASGIPTTFNASTSAGMFTMDYWRTPEPLEIVGIYALVITAITASATLVDGVITLYQMLTNESETSAFPVPLVAPEGASTAYATLTLKAAVSPGYAVGKVLRRLFNPIIWLPGIEFKLYSTTQLAASGAGTMMCGLLVDFHPESGANCAKIVDLSK